MFGKFSLPKIYPVCLAFLFGVVFGMASIVSMTPMGESPAMHLPNKFGTLSSSWSSDDYIAFFVGDRDAYGEVAVPPESLKNGVMTQIFYSTNAGRRLVHANLSATSGWHHFEIVDWDNIVTAYVDIQDSANRAVLITDVSGILAVGSRDTTNGAYTLNSPEGMLLATISPNGDGKWSVSVEHCSEISKITYALLAGYETVLSGGRAKAI